MNTLLCAAHINTVVGCMVQEYTPNFNPYFNCFLLFSPYIFQVERFGKPTWRRLVEAVKNEMGGSNPALAEAIAKDHLGR